MVMSLNNILIIVSILGVVVFVFLMYQRSKMKTNIVIEEDYATIEAILEGVKQEMVEIVKDDDTLGISEAEFNALYKRKARIQSALKNSVHGIDSAKIIVIELIRGFIDQNVPKERIIELLGLSDGMRPSDHTMFEILMYRYKKDYGKRALGELLDKYQLAEEREATSANRSVDKAYFVTIEDLHKVYEQEAILLNEEEIVDIMAVLIYQRYKGFGIIDTLREMDINGINCGTSGSIMSNAMSQRDGTLKATNSVWLYYQGKYIHLRFLNFGSEEELRRIVNLLVRYNSPGALTAKRGYLVNTMYDKSRILALRPPASEYWAIFIRKFTISDPSPKNLIIKQHTVRGDLPIRLIEFLMRGLVTCAVTGRQGSGKTTLMTSIIRYIDPRYTIRILEMAPELYLREIYPSRNILSVQQTQTVTATELQDALKKSDAAVSIVGEVATDEIAARMIQMGMTASLFTIFSHHANTPKDLVLTLRNSLVNAGGFNNMSTAERQVTEVVKMDIHLDYSPDGDRFVERISEIVPLEESIPYAEYDPNRPEDSINEITRDYYTRQTDRVGFQTRTILYYDKKTKTYHTDQRISRELESFIRNNLGELKQEYDKFMMAEWGRRPLEEGVFDEVTDSMLAYYRDEEISETVKETFNAGEEPLFPSIQTLDSVDLQKVQAVPSAGFTLNDVEDEDTKFEVLQTVIKEEMQHEAEELAKPPEVSEDEADALVQDEEDIKLVYSFLEGGTDV